MESGFYVERTFLGNLGELNSTSVIQYEFPKEVEYSKKDVGFFISCCDLFGAIIFLLFISYKKKQIKRDIEIADLEITAADYSVRIKGLPDDATRDEIRSFCEARWGKVIDVALCKNDMGITQRYRKKGKLLIQMESDRARGKDVSKCTEKLDKLEEEINKVKEKLGEPRLVCAYVTFLNTDDRDACRRDYPNKCCQRWMVCCMNKWFKFRETYRIRVYDADEPSNIIFENQKYSKTSICMRRGFTLWTVMLAIIISAIVIGATSWYKNSLPSSTECADTMLTFAQVSDSTSSEVDCYCAGQSIDAIYHDSPEGIQELCKNYILNLMKSRGLTVLCSLVIVIINFILQTFSTHVVKFEKHVSRTREELQLTWKLFLGLFINTGLITLAVNADMSQWVAIWTGPHADFTPDWYFTVGVSIVITLLVNMVNPHFINLLYIPMGLCSRCRARKNAKTQHELLKAYEGWDFPLASRYAIMLNTIFMTYFLASAMPLLLLIGGCTFFFIFVCDKIILLRQCQTPPKYNADLGLFALSFCKSAVYLHICFAAWTYGTDVVLDSYMLGESVSGYLEAGSHPLIENVLFRWNGFIHFLFFILCIGFEITFAVLYAFKLDHLLHLICCCCRRGHKIQVANPDYYTARMKSIRFESYQLHDQKEWKDAFAPDCLKPTAALFQEELGKKSILDAVVHISSPKKKSKCVRQLLTKPLLSVGKKPNVQRELLDEHV